MWHRMKYFSVVSNDLMVGEKFVSFVVEVVEEMFMSMRCLACSHFVRCSLVALLWFLFVFVGVCSCQSFEQYEYAAVSTF